MSKNLKKRKHSVFLAVLFILIPLLGFNFSISKDAPGLSAIPNKKSYSPGESGVLTLTFKTGSKVKIPKDPGVTLELTTSDIEGQGMQDYSGGDGDYISNSKVKYDFIVPANAEIGSTLTISGSVKFGYCTVSDGVCKLGNRNFTAKIKVK